MRVMNLKDKLLLAYKEEIPCFYHVYCIYKFIKSTHLMHPYLHGDEWDKMNLKDQLFLAYKEKISLL